LGYGVAAGGFLAVLGAGVDAIAVSAYGHDVPWLIVPILLGLYLAIGWVGGGFVVCVHALVANRRLVPHDAGRTRTEILDGCLFALAGVYAASFVQLLVSAKVDGDPGRCFVYVPLGAGIGAAVLGLFLSTRTRLCRSTRRSYAWLLICVALFSVFWRPFNGLYQAPGLSLVSLIANLVYVLLAVGVYHVGNRLAQWVPPSLSIQSVGRCLLNSALCIAIALPLALICMETSQPGRIPAPNSAAHRDPALRNRPNIVLIVMDTTRADHLSVYGYHRNTTPNLKAFAEHAVRYSRAVATSPWTLPSHASMLTGLMPSEHNADVEILDANGLKRAFHPLADAYTTLAEALRDNGYDTAAVVSNTILLTRQYGLDQGFLYYDDRQRATLGTASPTALSPATWLCKTYQSFTGGLACKFRSADQINEAVIDWLDHGVQTPFFLFVNYMEAHQPYEPYPEFDPQLDGGGPTPGATDNLTSTAPRPGLSEYQDDLRAYDVSIAYMDAHIGRLFEELNKRGLYDNAMIIVTADHGEGFGDHGQAGHAYTLYEEETRAPLLIRYPAAAASGTRHDPISLASLPSMVLEEAGIPHARQRYPALGCSRQEVISELRPFRKKQGRPGWVVRALYTSNHLKVITGTNLEGGAEVYDLIKDPYELADLSATRAATVEWADSWFQEWSARAATQRHTADTEKTNKKELHRRLAALGYISD